jgi:hypothetical protein
MRFELLPPGMKPTKRGQIWRDGDVWRVFPSGRPVVVPPPDPADKPVGLPGPPGKDAPPAKDGKDGRDGTGFRYAGPWHRKARYQPNDIVTHEGATWCCLVLDAKGEPHEGSKQWALWCKSGDDAPEQSSITYAAKGARGPAGTVEQVETGWIESVALGDCVYIAGDGIAGKASAAPGDSTQATAVGFVSGPNTYQTFGPLFNPVWTLNPGKVYYLSPTTPGGITDVYPTGSGQFVCIVGSAITPQKLNIKIHWFLEHP